MRYLHFLRQEIVFCIGGEVGLSGGLTTQGFTGTDELQVIQTTGNALVTVAVESIEVDACTAVHTGVNLGAGQHRIAVSIHNAGSRSGIGIDEVGVGIGGVIGTLHITVTERSLDGCERRHGAAVALQLGLTFLVGGFDGSLNLGYGFGVGLGNDEADTVLGSAAVDALGFPDVGLRPAGVGTGDDLHRVVDSVCVVRHIKIPP